MRPILVISFEVEWMDVNGLRILGIYDDNVDNQDKYVEIVFKAIDDKFNPY